MLSCKEASKMIASDVGDRRSLGDRLALALHLAMCRYCRAYARSLRMIGDTARRLYRPASDDAERSQSTLDAVRRAISEPPSSQ
jgi:hypothetical protein